MEHPDTLIGIRRLEISRFSVWRPSKPCGCDLFALRVGDIALSGAVRDHGEIVQKKTGKGVLCTLER